MTRDATDSLKVLTLQKRADFLRLRHGKKFTTPYFILRSGPADVPLGNAVRVGFTVTTKCGNAVLRNRTKRRLRALVRELFPTHAQAGTDYMFVALAGVTPSVADAPYEALRAAMVRALTHGKKP